MPIVIGSRCHTESTDNTEKGRLTTVDFRDDSAKQASYMAFAAPSVRLKSVKIKSKNRSRIIEFLKNRAPSSILFGASRDKSQRS